MKTGFSFGLEGLVPDEGATLFSIKAPLETDLEPLTEHHENTTDTGTTSWYLLHDTSAGWAVAGQPPLLSARVERAPEAGLFRMEHQRHTLAPLAQAWLIEHGCPGAAAVRLADGLPRPGDPFTVIAENRLRRSRLRILDQWHGQDESWVMGIDKTARARPLRVFLETARADTYSLKEGAFASTTTARAWLRGDRRTPLPPPPSPDLRVRAARSRSSYSSSVPAYGEVPAPQGARERGRSL
ncbi:hypothetical protein [Streptomyces sp. Tu6071]|uniref:hypothetical protein n=1 Tax=Streptomyces sp. Tu6071 TaxID=355249 RepID=UPI0002EC6242|nr:hypothetical protein [Streptomyces sp. Tu6071]